MLRDDRLSRGLNTRTDRLQVVSGRGGILAAITKEEFGLELFEAIVCCGSILQLQQLREKTPPNRIKHGQLRKWQVAEQEQKARLRDLTKSLTDADLAELMRRYPFVSEL